MDISLDKIYLSKQDNIYLELFAVEASEKDIRNWIKQGHQKKLIKVLQKKKPENENISDLGVALIWNIKLIEALSNLNQNNKLFFLKAKIVQNNEIVGNELYIGMVLLAFAYMPVFCEYIRCCLFYDIIEKNDKSVFIWYLAKTDNFNSIKKWIKELIDKELDFMELVETLIFTQEEIEIIWLRAFFENLKYFYKEKGFSEVEFVNCKYKRLSWWRKIDDRYMCKITNANINNILKNVLKYSYKE